MLPPAGKRESDHQARAAREVDRRPSHPDILGLAMQCQPMITALAAIDPAALRPHSDCRADLLRTETWIHNPIAWHGDVPEIRTVILLRTARDPETGRLLVSSYTHAGLVFEADDFDGAMRRAIEIVPNFAAAAALPPDGIAIVLDEYPSIDHLGFG
jgi:hypothetical protein